MQMRFLSKSPILHMISFICFIVRFMVKELTETKSGRERRRRKRRRRRRSRRGMRRRRGRRRRGAGGGAGI